MPPASAPFGITHQMLAPDQRVMLVAPKACVAVVRGSGSLGTGQYEPHQCWSFAGSLPAHATAPTELILAEPQDSSMDSETLWRARQ